MAVEPLYNDKSVVLEKLRMSGSSDDDTLAVIDQAISDVRLSFYRRLTLDRAIEIAALSLVDNPTTTDEVLRSVAAITEVYWIAYKLFCILPHMYIETQFAIKDNFDDVPITRDSDTLKTFMPCLWNYIEQGLGQLMLPIDNNTGDFKSFSTGRPTPYLLGNNMVGLPRATI